MYEKERAHVFQEEKLQEEKKRQDQELQEERKRQEEKLQKEKILQEEEKKRELAEQEEIARLQEKAIGIFNNPVAEIQKIQEEKRVKEEIERIEKEEQEKNRQRQREIDCRRFRESTAKFPEKYFVNKLYTKISMTFSQFLSIVLFERGTSTSVDMTYTVGFCTVQLLNSSDNFKGLNIVVSRGEYDMIVDPLTRQAYIDEFTAKGFKVQDEIKTAVGHQDVQYIDFKFSWPKDYTVPPLLAPPTNQEPALPPPAYSERVF
jgi:hypothetical protein